MFAFPSLSSDVRTTVGTRCPVQGHTKHNHSNRGHHYRVHRKPENKETKRRGKHSDKRFMYAHTALQRLAQH